jgi:hypothetical protein
MNRAYRFISSFVLAAALVAPVAIVAASPQVSVQFRAYDRDHRDYHNWDDREDRAYRSYLAEQHRAYRDFRHQKRGVQRNYWNWRHSHPDRN